MSADNISEKVTNEVVLQNDNVVTGQSVIPSAENAITAWFGT